MNLEWEAIGEPGGVTYAMSLGPVQGRDDGVLWLTPLDALGVGKLARIEVYLWLVCIPALSREPVDWRLVDDVRLVVDSGWLVDAKAKAVEFALECMTNRAEWSDVRSRLKAALEERPQ
jgi:hypothetical protein